MAKTRQQLAQHIAALYKQAGLPQPTAAGVNHYLNKGEAGLTLLRENLSKDKRTTFYQQPGGETGTGAPTDLLSIYTSTFGPEAGAALFKALQPPTPRSNEELTAGFNTQFNPYFQEQQNLLQGNFDTQTQRNEQDFNTAQTNFDAQALQANNNALGQQNLQFGDTFGSPMQQQQEQLRQVDLQRQRDLMQQNFSRRTYDLGQQKTQDTRQMGYQKEQALADYTNQNRYSNIIA